MENHLVFLSDHHFLHFPVYPLFIPLSTELFLSPLLIPCLPLVLISLFRKLCMVFSNDSPSIYCLLYSLSSTLTHFNNLFSSPPQPPHPQPFTPAISSHLSPALGLFFLYLVLCPRPANGAWDWLINGCLSALRRQLGYLVRVERREERLKRKWGEERKSIVVYLSPNLILK